MVKENMTSRERVLACINNEDTDQLPLINPTSVANSDSCKLAGVKLNDAHLNTDKMAALAGVSYEVLGFDSVMPHFSVVQEAAAFGCEIDWGSNEALPSQKTTILEDPDQFSLPSGLLDRLPIKTVIDAIGLLRKKYGRNAAVIGKVMGPWTLSYHLYGVEKFLMDTIEEPEKVAAFLDKFKEITLRFAEAQFEAGADMVTLADHATADLVSPGAYVKYLLPVHKYITQRLKGKIVILHCCGNTRDRIPYFAEAGFPVFHFDSRNDIEKTIEAAGGMKLTGCVNNPEVLLRGSAEDVKKQVKTIIEGGIRLVSPECAIPPKVSNRNLAAIGQVMRNTQISIS